MYSIVDGVSNTRVAIDSFLQIIKADGFQNSIKLLPDLTERIQNIESKNPIFLNAIDMRLQNLEKNIDAKSSQVVASSLSSPPHSVSGGIMDLTSPEKDRIAAHVMVEIDKCKHDVYNYVMESLSLFQSETLSPVQAKMDNLGQAVQILSEVIFDIQKNIFNEDDHGNDRKEGVNSPLDPSNITQKNNPFYDGLKSPLLSPPDSPTNEIVNTNISNIDTKTTPDARIVDDMFSSDEED
jgi:hypothetical protein